MKKLLISLLTFLVTLGGITQLAVTSANSAELSKRGQLAIEQIATCINSDGKDVLNVLYLIDESGSLKQNDPNALRVQGLIQSLQQFRDVSSSKPYFKINRAITTFGSAFTIRKSWSNLTPQSIDDDVNWINENIPKLVKGQFTDWNSGLKGALTEFKKVQSPSSCNVMVWFTDGGISVQNSPIETRISLAEICGADPVTGQVSGKKAVIDEFRESGINIQGVLLRNQSFLDDPIGFTNGQITKEEADNERARMSFFLPVIEQTAGVSAGAFTQGGVSTFNCGSYVGAGGVLQIVADPIDIIWPPVQFSCLSENGRIIPIEKNGTIKVDAALTRFSLTSPVKLFSLKNGENQEIANGQGAYKGDVQLSFLNSSKSIIKITGKVSPGNTVVKPGIWSVRTSDIERSVFCGYLDLDINLSVGTCYIGEKCDYSGAITRFGRPINMTDFTSVKVSASEVDSQGKLLPGVALMLDPSTSQFASSFTPGGLSQVAYLKISLKVTTQTGIEFSSGTIKPIAVIPPGLYPEVSPSPVNIGDFSQGLIGKSGQAIASLTLKGPSRTNGQICIGPLQVRSDVNPNRIQGYESRVDGQDLKSNPCFTVLAGNSSIVDFTIKNSDSADGSVSGYITAILKSDGKEPIETKVDVQFETSTQVDKGKFRLLLALLMFLGLALPLTLLSIINARNSRIILDNIYRATIPVVLSASGNFVGLSRLEKLKGTDLVSQEDFSPFSSGKEITRSKQIGSEVLKGITPLNPFGSLHTILSTTPGLAIASSSNEQSRKRLESNEVHGALNPSGLAYVTLTDQASQQLRAENQGNRDSGDRIEGTLTALLSLNSGDPVAQVDYLNTKIMHEGGWLNSLLTSVAPQGQQGASQAKVKGGKKEKVKVKSQPIPAADDEWGSSTTEHSSSSNAGSSEPTSPPKTAGNDWGGSNSSSDWDSPGSVNDSKEEW